MAKNARAHRARHTDTQWRSVGTAGNDTWQRQADAAAWSAVSGLHPSLYLGAIEPIPVPADLREQLREAGRALADRPSAERAATLLRLAHRAAYGKEATDLPIEPDSAPVEAAEDAWWTDTPAEAEKPLAAPGSAATLAAFAAEAAECIRNAPHDPEGGGEAPETPDEWWNA